MIFLHDWAMQTETYTRRKEMWWDLSIRATITSVQARMYVFVMQCP